MFGKYDKVTLTLTNAKDINGNILPFILELPLKDDYSLPEELVSIGVFEGHDGLVTSGRVVYSIYIGEETTLNDLIDDIKNGNIEILENAKRLSFGSPVCIQNVLEKKVVFAMLNDQDIVVENQEQLKEVIGELSNNFEMIKNSASKIRTLSRK